MAVSTNQAEGSRKATFIERARQEQIRAAAVEVLAQHGYADTTIAKIARQLNVSKGVITYHFASKEEILTSVVEDFYARGWLAMQPVIEAAETPLDKLHAWIRSQSEFFGKHRSEFLAMTTIVSEYRNPDGGFRFTDEYQEEDRAVAQILESGQREGQFRQFDASSFARIILRACDGVLGTWALNPSFDLHRHISDLLDFVNHAICKDP